MRKKYNNPKLKFYLGDMQDSNSIKDAMRGIDFVFHAEALKTEQMCLLNIYIKMGEIHRLKNEGKIDVVLIEAQVGEYTGEDDIVRLQDDFKRVYMKNMLLDDFASLSISPHLCAYPFQDHDSKTSRS